MNQEQQSAYPVSELARILSIEEVQDRIDRYIHGEGGTTIENIYLIERLAYPSRIEQFGLDILREKIRQTRSCLFIEWKAGLPR